eukprot:7541703-Alexandrium_andersonii.AAC.1
MPGGCRSSTSNVWGICFSSNSAKAPPARPPGGCAPSRASDADAEAVPGLAQFKLREPEAGVHSP